MRKGWIYKLKLLLLSTVAVTTIVQTISHPTRHLLLLPIAAMATMETSCKEDTLSPSDYTEQPPDACPSWDRDCDGISNAVETNDANSYLNLDTNAFNANPSIAHGCPCTSSCYGWIENALNLMNEGTGYYHYRGPDAVDTDDWGVLDLINMIEGAGRDWDSDYRVPPRIGVGDLSWGDQYTQQFGGPWDHSCHQNGLEVDIRYVRNDGLDTSLNIAESDSVYYNPAATSFLMNRLIDHADIEVILYDSVHAGILGWPLLHWPGHSDHFHVRIEDPDGTGN